MANLDPVEEIILSILGDLYNDCDTCTRCDLHKNRTRAVLGDGPVPCDLMFIGEAPGEEEDKQARPFVGRAGQLLNKSLQEVGLSRKEVYITNMVKCRPPANRDPSPAEMERCLIYLIEQIDFVKPKMIVALGRIAASYLLQREIKITKERGRLEAFPYNDNILISVVYHPSYVLRNRSAQVEKDFHQDLLDVRNIVYGKSLDDFIYDGSIG